MAIGATRALIEATREPIDQVRSSEMTLDRFQVEIDSEVIRLITVYSPVAKDLRLLLMMARINSELERIGDEAMDICEHAEVLLAAPAAAPTRELSGMSALALRMLHDAIAAFPGENVETARAVIDLDDQVDAMNAEIAATLLNQNGVTGGAGTRSIGLILAARSLERIADHATNICEEVYYLVKAEDIRHRT
jgi:phosphate transport system protein